MPWWYESSLFVRGGPISIICSVLRVIKGLIFSVLVNLVMLMPQAASAGCLVKFEKCWKAMHFLGQEFRACSTSDDCEVQHDWTCRYIETFSKERKKESVEALMRKWSQQPTYNPVYREAGYCCNLVPEPELRCVDGFCAVSNQPACKDIS
jgi:hypothetical protein